VSECERSEARGPKGFPGPSAYRLVRRSSPPFRFAMDGKAETYLHLIYIVVYFALMKILWDENKNHKLMFGRGISFEVFANIILDKKYIDIIENPSRPSQLLFIIIYNNYTYAIPFVIDKDHNIVLKTAFRSRKFHKIYGGKTNEN
jgi:uncharacterized DUF497 family protein